MFKIKVKKGYEPEDVLEKALKSLRGQRRNKLEDPYLRKLYNHAKAMYKLLSDCMVEDILEVLYPEKDLKKSRSNLVLIEVDVHTKHGTHRSKKWVRADKGLADLKGQLKAQLADGKEIQFKNKTTGKVDTDEAILEAYRKQGKEESLQSFIRDQYTITPKPIDKPNTKSYTRYSKRQLKDHWYKARQEGLVFRSTTKDKYLQVAADYEAILGEKTSDGHTIKEYTLHTIDRTIGTDKDPKTGLYRHPTNAQDVLSALKTADPKSGRNECFIYEIKSTKVVFNQKLGRIVTVVGKKQKGNKNGRNSSTV